MAEIYSIRLQKLSTGFRIKAYSDKEPGEFFLTNWDDVAAKFQPYLDEKLLEDLRQRAESSSFGVPVFLDGRVVKEEVIKALGFQFLDVKR